MRTIRLAFALVVGLSALLVVGIASATTYHSSLVTHDLGLDGEFKTRYSQTYSDFTTEHITMGASYLYAKAVDGCLHYRDGRLVDGEGHTHPSGFTAETITPGQCDPQAKTYTWADWQGDTFDHGTQGGIFVEVFVMKALGGSRAGWMTWWLEDLEIDSRCASC